jgi:hypothetical protein
MKGLQFTKIAGFWCFENRARDRKGNNTLTTQGNNLFVRSLSALWLRVKAIALITVDIRDILFFSGLVSLWYGLWLKDPWISFVVCGAILMFTGYIMRSK